MKLIGLLGGMSWESSIEYERIINQEVRARLGGTHSANLIIRSFDFAEIEKLQAAGRWDDAGALLAAAAKALETAGAELIVLCTNTMHKLADHIVAAIGIPFLHIADATGEAIKAQRLTTVGLLGTAYTMEQPFYKDRLASKHGLDVITPNDADRAIIHRVIYDELVRGVISEVSRAEYLRIIGDLVAQGCEGIIAGCTEIELLVGPSDVSVPYFPTTHLHALAAVAAAL
jgi:aspartate racemase